MKRILAIGAIAVSVLAGVAAAAAPNVYHHGPPQASSQGVYVYHHG